jgi:Na+-translocating ferredoxin:NAD+ oxidoreductase subunit D
VTSPAQASVTGLMLPVMLALIPAVMVQVWLFGFDVIVTVLVAITSALVIEALVLRWRNLPVRAALADGSAAVTGALLGLAVAPQLGTLELLVGVAFAIAVAKHCYGGLGRNLFNPAMAGYALLIVSFPAAIAVWPVPGLLESAVDGMVGAAGLDVDALSIDGISAATPLDTARASARGASATAHVAHTHAWMWVNAAWLVGGIGLLAHRTITWLIPASVVAGIVLVAGVLWATAGGATPWVHLSSGASMACAFFIATDPVSAPRDKRALLVYGMMIGAITVLIREYGAYPDGVAFAVLLANSCAPLLDRATLYLITQPVDKS